MEKIRLAILASGGGTTAEAIMKSGGVEVVVVIGNNSNKGVEVKAKDSNVPFVHLPRTPYKVFSGEKEDVKASQIKYGEALLEQLGKFNVTHISQNGWMVPTPVNVIEAFEGRIFNQHPGPLDPGNPDFGGDGMYGARVHGTVLRFARETGHLSQTEATIHRVEEKYDEGPLMMTEAIDILEGDTAATLADRLLPVEHALQIKFWKQMSEGGVEEFSRETRLISEEDIPTLERIKQEVIEEYSKKG
jgi:phosphoribosylglycinamide formyltransferase 1